MAYHAHLPLTLPICHNAATLPLFAGLESLAACEHAAKLEDVQAQVAWDAEAARVQLGKLSDFWSSQLAIAEVAVTGCAHGLPGLGVSSPTMPPEVQVRVCRIGSLCRLFQPAINHLCMQVMFWQGGSSA